MDPGSNQTVGAYLVGLRVVLRVLPHRLLLEGSWAYRPLAVPVVPVVPVGQEAGGHLVLPVRLAVRVPQVLRGCQVLVAHQGLLVLRGRCLVPRPLPANRRSRANGSDLLSK